MCAYLVVTRGRLEENAITGSPECNGPRASFSPWHA